MGTDVSPSADLPRLRPAERRVLRIWLDRVRPTGIERVEDLGDRDWANPRPAFILGVFRQAEPLATWLLVGDAEHWAVADCASGSVSRPYPSLAAALAALDLRLPRYGR